MTIEERRAYFRAYYHRNKTKLLQWKKQWLEKNPSNNPRYQAAYKARNKAKIKAYNKQWSKQNAGKVTDYSRAYQLLKKNRMPKWLTDKDRQCIKDFYTNRPVGYHVDHIIPLKGKNVSGLHVPWNLQYLLALENVKKSNKF